MGSLVDMIFPEKGDFFSSQGTVVQHQDQRLVAERHGSKDLQEEIRELALTGNPGC